MSNYVTMATDQTLMKKRNIAPGSLVRLVFHHALKESRKNEGIVMYERFEENKWRASPTWTGVARAQLNALSGSTTTFVPGEIGFVVCVVKSSPNKKTLDHCDAAYIVTPTKSGWIWLYKEVREVL